MKEEGEVCGALGRSRTCHLSTKGSYPAGVHRISFWGGDDFCLSMHDADQTMTLEETKRFLLALPNPVSQEWLWSLKHNGRPLFQSG